jgi:hypothetical protein
MIYDQAGVAIEDISRRSSSHRPAPCISCILKKDPYFAQCRQTDTQHHHPSPANFKYSLQRILPAQHLTSVPCLFFQTRARMWKVAYRLSIRNAKQGMAAETVEGEDTVRTAVICFPGTSHPSFPTGLTASARLHHRGVVRE